MIIHQGTKYRGISQHDGAYVFRYADPQGCEHRMKCQTIHEAIALYYTKKDMKHKGGMPAPEVLRRGRVRFREIARDALAHSDEHKRSARNDHGRMGKLLEWFGEKRADSITPQDIETKFQGEAWSPATWNRYRALLSLTYRLAIRNHKMKENPARLVSHKTEHNERVRFLTPEEERKLRGAILEKHSERLAEFELALHTGLRVSEQYGALWEHVDWQQRILTVPIDKGGRTSHVPLNAVALAALSELYTRTANTGLVCGGSAGPRVWFEACLKVAGIADFSWHCLRHTFASRLVMSGADIRTVAELLRDRTLAMVMRYAHVAPDYRMEAVQRMQDKFNAESPSVNTNRVNSGTESGSSCLVGDAYLQ